MGHTVSDAAARSVEKSKEKKAHVERTPKQIIDDIRKNLDAKLAVTPGDIRALLAEYDKNSAVIYEAADAIVKQSVSEKAQADLEPINGD